LDRTENVDAKRAPKKLEKIGYNIVSGRILKSRTRT